MPRPSEWFNRPFNEWTWPMVTLVALVLVVIAGVVLSLVLAGCAQQPGGQGTSGGNSGVEPKSATEAGFTEAAITLSDGRTITCITWSDHDTLVTGQTSSGISCDWITQE
jgi:hypothetical protein